MSKQTLSAPGKLSNSSDTISLASLLQGKRYTWIKHAGETYLLQLTKSNKLLLTK